MITAYIMAMFCEKIFKYIYDDDFKNTPRHLLFIEITIQVVLSGILSYIGRNIITAIPSPLNNICNLDHTKVNELNSGGVLMMFLIIFQPKLQKKIAYIRELL
jgi:hypothetical protein